MDKLKTYKKFEGIRNTTSGKSENYEEKIDNSLLLLYKQKQLVSLLGDTINHISSEIQKSMPLQLDEFIEDLEHYDEIMKTTIEEIREKMIDGYPNMKDMIEEIESDFILIERFLKSKKLI